jgi:hypothetical protein
MGNYRLERFLYNIYLFFLSRKFSSEQRDLDDADEDGNTIYRGLAVPVDIRQVVEVRIYKYNLIIYFYFFNSRYLMDII